MNERRRYSATVSGSRESARRAASTRRIHEYVEKRTRFCPDANVVEFGKEA
jgi:hypothetical protein